MSEPIPFRQSTIAGSLLGVASVLAVLPLSLLYELWPRSVRNEDFTVLILWANSGLISLLWGLPVWAWQRRRRPHFAFAWLCVHLTAALITGACLGLFTLKLG